MSIILTVDIGAGTMDILYYDTESGLHYKGVVKSPVLSLAEKASILPGNLLVRGTEMGGGPLSRVLKERAKVNDVVMSRPSAATINHDLEKVRSWGIQVVEDTKAEALGKTGGYHTLWVEDLQPARLEKIIEGFGVPFSFDVVGICAQDHGTPPAGVSHLDYRHNIFKNLLDKNPFPHALLYENGEIPPTFNRLGSIALSAERLPADEIYVMDSGMAAILGGAMDPHVESKNNLALLDIATSHTVGAAMVKGELAGFFEYHTHDISAGRIEDLLVDLCDGNLEHERILEEGGHGAYVRKSFGFNAVDAILATGPKRGLIESSRFSITFGSPLGDNMMTGTVGLLEAIRRRKGLGEISYL